MKHCSDHFQTTQNIVAGIITHSFFQLLKPCFVIFALEGGAATLVKIMKVCGALSYEQALFFLFLRTSSHQVVKNMIVSFAFSLVDHTRLLQQILFHHNARQMAAVSVLELDELAEPTGVVIANGFSIAKRFKHSVGFENVARNLGLFIFCCSQILADQLHALCFATATFTADDERRIKTTCDQRRVGFLCQRKNMWTDLRNGLSSINVRFFVESRNMFEAIHCDQHVP
eukprot:Lithocolla_globosa_v1_NODE_5630_length_1208_cov_2.985256.p2 type:complete len:229 gc:universal NODE_5630_length_1208_cov_2.985256:1095-409(-)